jgi:UDP-4-amino-4,6-dideoxy-N-acetyl-beta-L-altrosamine N-acetyltransferase
MKQHIELVPIISLSVETQFKVLAIRNEPKIRELMFMDHVIDSSEHIAWLNRLKQDRSQLVFVILQPDHEPIGVVTIYGIDRHHKKALWGFYTKEEHPKGLGTAVLILMLNFAFGDLGLEKLNAEVLETNKPAARLHERLGFTEEGHRRLDVEKSSGRFGIRLFGISKAEWLAVRPDLLASHKPVFDQFDIEIKWIPSEPREGPKSALDRMEAAQTRNNLNWMSILRLALEKAPAPSEQIADEIEKNDAEIRNLSEKLIKPQ